MAEAALGTGVKDGRRTAERMQASRAPREPGHISPRTRQGEEAEPVSLHRIYAGRTPYGRGLFWDNRQTAQAAQATQAGE